MDKTINQRELRNCCAAVLREVRAGNTITVTRNGDPIAELRSIDPRRFVSRATIAEAASLAPSIDFAQFRNDVNDAVDQSAIR